MKDQDPLRAFRALLDAVRVGILGTLSEDGYPHSRWMTAATLPRVHDCVYCVTTAGSPKVKELESCDRVQWSFQSPTLREIVYLRGRAAVVNNPGLAADLLEKYNPATAAARRAMLTQKYGVRITSLLNLLDEAENEDPVLVAVEG